MHLAYTTEDEDEDEMSIIDRDFSVSGRQSGTSSHTESRPCYQIADDGPETRSPHCVTMCTWHDTNTYAPVNDDTNAPDERTVVHHGQGQGHDRSNESNCNDSNGHDTYVGGLPESWTSQQQPHHDSGQGQAGSCVGAESSGSGFVDAHAYAYAYSHDSQAPEHRPLAHGHRLYEPHTAETDRVGSGPTAMVVTQSATPRIAGQQRTGASYRAPTAGELGHALVGGYTPQELQQILARITKTKSRPFTSDEVLRLLEHGFVGPFAKRDRCWFSLGLKTGLRSCEWLSVRCRDVCCYVGPNPDEVEVFDRVRIAKEHVKGKKHSRTVPLHEQVRQLIYEWVVYTRTMPCYGGGGRLPVAGPTITASAKNIDIDIESDMEREDAATAGAGESIRVIRPLELDDCLFRSAKEDHKTTLYHHPKLRGAAKWRHLARAANLSSHPLLLTTSGGSNTDFNNVVGLLTLGDQAVLSEERAEKEAKMQSSEQRRQVLAERGRVNAKAKRRKALDLSTIERRVIPSSQQANFNSGGRNEAVQARYLHGKAISDATARNILKRACARVGIVGRSGEYSLHSLRSTLAHRVFEASGYNIMAVKRALDHESIQTSQHYVSTSAEHVNIAELPWN